ncbi:MAG: serine/threonine-protein kinase, partial [Ktedonobacteraceae bacterium]
MADRIGQQFGNYRLLRLIGHGGFADVYLGEHIYMGTQAAIKLLHTQVGSKDIERFQQEARTIARLEHPHIVRVLEFGVEEMLPYLVLSYAPNGTLRERYPRGTVLPLPVVLEYVRQIADALQYAHSEKIIHRDIKPENMLIGRRNEILLTDFGIALIMQDTQSMGAKDLAGTAAYMSPEQIEAHPRAASDQYSLAIVVYEWLSGTCPFQGTFTEIAFKHAVAPIPPLRAKVPTLSAA